MKSLFFAGVAFTFLIFGSSVFGVADAEDLILGTHNRHKSSTPCDPGELGNITSQLPFQLWKSDKGNLPYYSNFDIETEDQRDIENVVIIAHGFGRNGNEYFCSGINTLLEIESLRSHPSNYGDFDTKNTLIITAQFLSNNDVCWDADGVAHYLHANDCGLPVWAGAGWIAGLKNLNTEGADAPDLFSYDVFNLMIDRLMDTKYFPNVKTTRMFGFSAGAQTAMRYVIYPQHSERMHVKTILGDPSTMLYFSDERISPDLETFSVPDPSWLSENSYLEAMNYTSWNSTVPKEDCRAYNDWKYGFENREGYLAMLSLDEIDQAVQSYIDRDITYLIGTYDNCNCQLESNDEWCYDEKGTCVDHSFDKTCSGMLQGKSRYDRMIIWLEYLEYTFPTEARAHSSSTHQLYSAPVGHDFDGMMRSEVGRCELFDYECSTALRNNQITL